MSKNETDIEYEIYKKYVEFYNSQDNQSNRVKAYGYICTIIARFEKKIPEYSEKMYSMLSSFEERLLDAALIDKRSKISFDEGRNKFFKHRLDVKFQELNSYFKQKYVFHELEIIKKRFSDDIRQYLEEVIGYNQSLSYKLDIDSIFNFGAKYLKTKMHYSSLKEIEDSIISRNYPLEISTSLVLDKIYSKNGESRASNETGKNWESRSKKLRDAYNKKILNETSTVIAENRDNYLTENYTCTNNLYKTVYRRLEIVKEDGKIIEKPSPSFVRDRINEFLSKGIL